MSEPEAEPTVRYSVAGGAATLTLNRPDSRNALDVATMTVAMEHLAEAAADDRVRVVILTGEGSAFCAGADLKGAASGSEGGFARNATEVLASLLATLSDHPKPTIARVQGHVAGGGNGLIAVCDLAVAADDVSFAFSEVRVGVAPAVIAVACLPVMHPRDAAELLLTGERVTADRVLRAGLLTRVVPRHELDTAVATWVDQLRRGGPTAVPVTKALLRELRGMSRADAFAYTTTLSAELFRSAEALEGMAAFLERRDASWIAAPEITG